jgi:glycosyltransferase involved in cell wall biosynthesis
MELPFSTTRQSESRKQSPVVRARTISTTPTPIPEERNMLYHLPLECYRERYTSQLRNWYHGAWHKYEIPFCPIIPRNEVGTIKHGQVLDAVGRCTWAMDQVHGLLLQAEKGAVKDSDVILVDDFWHPGIEALPYVFHQLGIRPRMYAYCWAQSVDEFDFTRQMMYFMRPFEKGIGRILDGIFVASTGLKEKLTEASIKGPSQVHVVGLPFDSEEVMSRMPENYRTGMNVHHSPPNRGKRRNQVVFSSRWDREKNPDFFCKVAAAMIEANPERPIRFVVCTSAPEFRSNDSQLLNLLVNMEQRYGEKFQVRENLSKEEYYAILAESKVQFNCADQDWWSFTLLEASVAGCWPIYPYFRSFPEVFRQDHDFMYQHKDVKHACNLLTKVLNHEDLWTYDQIKSREWIHARCDHTWKRMLKVMGFWNSDEEIPPVFDY